MAWNTGLACGFTATRSSGRNTLKYSADMMVASEADEAWCPPTLSPSVFERMWLAWWMVHDDSHSALRASAVNVSRRAESTGMAMLPENRSDDDTPAGGAKLLNFSRHTSEYWDTLPMEQPLQTGFIPMPDLDAIDRKILALLQNDSRLTMQELADKVGLSVSPCHRRVKLLEERGVICATSRPSTRRRWGCMSASSSRSSWRGRRRRI